MTGRIIGQRKETILILSTIIKIDGHKTVDGVISFTRYSYLCYRKSGKSHR